MKNGDIFRWHWKAKDKASDVGPYGSYHCKSQFAVFEGGKLYDTFWGNDPTDNSFLNPDDVHLELLGNRYDMGVLKDNPEYYRAEDLVDTRHSNDSNGKIYLKGGARRDKSVMLELVAERQNECARQMASLALDLRLLGVAEGQIEHGDINKVHF